jgi:hypothetical protein
MTEPQIISPDQWVVTGSDANHRRTWSVTVRASTLENAKRVALRHMIPQSEVAK